MIDSTMLSVSTWLMMRPRDPPSAARMAISRLRPVARTSSRFATFAHAISNTKPTAPTSTNSDCRTLRTSTSPIGSTLNPSCGPMLVRELRAKVGGRGAAAARCACSSVDALLHPGRGLEVMSVIRRVRIELERHPHLHWLVEHIREFEIVEDADHGMRNRAERNRLAHDLRIALAAGLARSSC